MQKILLTFLTLALCTFGVNSKESKITGNIPGAENEEIRLITYADLITYSEIILDRTIIDSAGFFSLTADITETCYCILDLDYYASGIFIEPGSVYRIKGDTILDISPYKPFYDKGDLVYQLDSTEDSDLNYLTSEFNNDYNTFIIENFDAVYKRRNKSLVESFKQDVQKKYSHQKNIYFQNYIKYKIASVELASAPVIKPQLFSKYFQGKPVLYNNVEYMHFFNQFFDKYLISQSKSITYKDLVSTINLQNSYNALLDTLGKDTLLRNEVIRELVLIKNLFELYNDPQFSGNNILSILNQLATTTVFVKHKQIAQSCIKKLTRLESGTLAPQFTLPDLNGRSVSLSDFQGTPVYLSFLATWSSACLGEYKLLDSLYQKYKNSIKFITISLDKNKEILTQFVNDKGYDWLFLYNGTHYDLINSYEIKTFPLFVLLDEEGRIIQYPAYKPSEIIEEAFIRLKEKKSKSR